MKDSQNSHFPPFPQPGMMGHSNFPSFHHQPGMDKNVPGMMDQSNFPSFGPQSFGSMGLDSQTMPFPQPGMKHHFSFPQPGMDKNFGSSNFGSSFPHPPMSTSNGMMGRDSQNMMMGPSVFTSRFGPALQQQTTVIEIVPALASTESEDSSDYSDSDDSADSADSADSDDDYSSSEESVEDQSQKLVDSKKLVDSIVQTALANANEQIATAKAQGAAVMAQAQAQGAALLASAKAQEAAALQRLPHLDAQHAAAAQTIPAPQPVAPVDGNQWRSWPQRSAGVRHSSDVPPP